MSSDLVVILCTAPDVDVGARLARGLLEAKLAACVNLVPGLRSIYTWKGEVCDEGEVQLVIKTSARRSLDVERFLDAEHPYEVPEVIVLPVTGGSAKYLAWVDKHTRA